MWCDDIIAKEYFRKFRENTVEFVLFVETDVASNEELLRIFNIKLPVSVAFKNAY